MATDSGDPQSQVASSIGSLEFRKITIRIRGIIITSAPDDRIKYAMLVSSGISFYTYKVSFDLVEEQPA
jgi:hypothetical protein